MPGRHASVSDYRYGFNGKEMDDQIKSITGSSYDFGARMYDSRVGRFLSTDPLASSFASNSPYLYANNSPIYFVDEEGKSGKAYKTNMKNEKTGNPILRVVSNVYIYGEGATEARATALKSEINAQYNNGGNYFTHTDDNGTVYDVVFEIEVKTKLLGDALNGIREASGSQFNSDAKPEDNYYLVGNKNGGSYTIDGNVAAFGEGSRGGNTGYFDVKELDNKQNTGSHELNHGFGGENHPASPPINDGSDPEISLPSNQQYSDGSTIDPSKRKVTQSTINNIFKNVKFNKNGEGNVGNPRRSSATGNGQKSQVSTYP